MPPPSSIRLMIEVIDLTAVAGDLTLDAVSLAVPQGEYAVLMGPTGSGKTTLLECLCGLRPVTSGEVRLAGRDATDLPPRARGIGYVPQDGALFVTHTVREHLAFSLEVRGRPRTEVAQRCDELAELLHLGPLMDRLPERLSGGERQRVALGRALASRPAVLLLDEPLSAVDESARAELHQVLRDVQRQTGVTTLHVTHHRGEATALADCTFTMRQGRVSGGLPDASGAVARLAATDP